MAVTERLCTVLPAVAGVGRGLIAANHAVWKCMLHVSPGVQYSCTTPKAIPADKYGNEYCAISKVA